MDGSKAVWDAASGGGVTAAIGADNRIATFSDTDALNGEATLIFDSNILSLLADSSSINFGVNSEITLTHSHDAGLNLKHTATGDDKPILTLQTGETDIAANDKLELLISKHQMKELELTLS